MYACRATRSKRRSDWKYISASRRFFKSFLSEADGCTEPDETVLYVLDNRAVAIDHVWWFDRRRRNEQRTWWTCANELIKSFQTPLNRDDFLTFNPLTASKWRAILVAYWSYSYKFAPWLEAHPKKVLFRFSQNMARPGWRILAFTLQSRALGIKKASLSGFCRQFKMVTPLEYGFVNHHCLVLNGIISTSDELAWKLHIYWFLHIVMRLTRKWNLDEILSFVRII